MKEAFALQGQREVEGTFPNTNSEEAPTIIPPRDTAGRIRWSILQQTPEILTAYLEQEARALQESGFDFSRKGFVDKGIQNLQYGFQYFYPGGMPALREYLGNVIRNPAGYWSSEEGFERMRSTVREMHDTHGTVTQELLRDNNYHDVAAAIINKYPGGWYGILHDLDIPFVERPKGYWTEETILAEARQFYKETGVFSQRALVDAGRNDLVSAMSKHGGMQQFRARLGIAEERKTHGYWTIERIEQEAREFYDTYGGLTRGLLAQQGRQDLIQAIKRTYPGSINALRETLGVPGQKPKGYWNDNETIEREAREFYLLTGLFTRRAVLEQGTSGLAQAITANYPGGFATIREKLGITSTPQKEKISPHEANKELAQFLEEEDE